MTDENLVKDGVTVRTITFKYDDLDASATIAKGTDMKDLNEKLKALSAKFGV